MADGLMATTRVVGEGAGQYVEVYQHFGAVPGDVVDSVVDLLTERKRSRPSATRREIYVEALQKLIAEIKRGETVEISAPAAKGRDVHVWLTEDIAQDLETVCQTLNRRKNAVFITALRRYLSH